MSDKRPVVYDANIVRPEYDEPVVIAWPHLAWPTVASTATEDFDNAPNAIWCSEQDAAAILLAYQRGELCFKEDMPVCPHCEIQPRAMAGSKARCYRCGSRLRPIKDISHEIEFADDDE